ncbi:hypothetical protein OsI_36320 [Oryza sativa Indica Group]|uniref:Uncharacterized protein n=1 Tax=Oryza sativa subsp. indica TaxID=39946 RepID=A2ZEV3_ORYSI|nr:hypothetical protein OsI_36320 [Oryza sativa Indica Group]
MEPINITSVRELEEAIGKYGAGESVRVTINVANVFEADELLRLIGDRELEVRWELSPGGMDMLRSTADYYLNLDLLYEFMDLMRLDLRDGVPVKKSLFDWIRTASTDVLTSSHPSSTRRILEQITLEAQLIGRVAKGLGFGADDVQQYLITPHEMSWYLEEDAVAVRKRRASLSSGDAATSDIAAGASDPVELLKNHKQRLLDKVAHLQQVISSSKSAPYISQLEQ